MVCQKQFTFCHELKISTLFWMRWYWYWLVFKLNQPFRKLYYIFISKKYPLYSVILCECNPIERKLFFNGMLYMNVELTMCMLNRFWGNMHMQIAHWNPSRRMTYGVIFCVGHDIAAYGPSKIQAISKDMILKTLSSLFTSMFTRTAVSMSWRETRELMICLKVA